MEAATEMALVATKLTAPTVPGGLVERPRLEGMLDGAVADPAVRLVLVSAPAGSGKSTLIAAWQRDRDDCAWLQADRADQDPARFWSHVVGALGTVVPGVEAEAGPTVAASAAEADPLVERLANTLAASPPVVLVIDDYHLVGDPAIDDALGRLIELAPLGFTLVLGTRFDPSLRLSTLRVRGQVVEVRADTLHFAPEEAGLLLGAPGADLTPPQVVALCERTEGWAAGLVLAGLSLDGNDDHDAFVTDFQGDDRLVVDYLTEEFLAGIDDEDRDRLLRTAVLDRLCGPLVDAVCGGDAGTAWLQRTASRNQLLIGLDRTGTWFRYHHLLADVLRSEAERQGIDVERSHR
ncbi:MAG: AAA family ATPase, partial [Actinomycetota bacterium]